MYQITPYLADFKTYRGSVTYGGGNPLLIVPASPFRVYIAVCNTNGTMLYLSDDPNFTPPTCPWHVGADGTQEFFWERHGVLPTLALYGTVKSPLPGGGAIISWFSMEWQPVSG